MTELKQLEVWFVTGSQHLYGAETLVRVAEHAQTIAGSLDGEDAIPVRVLFKPVLTTPDEIRALCREANNSSNCIGLVLWMHTFSPAKMWIAGLNALQKPTLHLHTQFNRELPWPSIDMDFMNLNQSAHGDREFGFNMNRRQQGLRRNCLWVQRERLWCWRSGPAHKSDLRYRGQPAGGRVSCVVHDRQGP